MYFEDIINARISQESDRPLMQKDVYPVGMLFQQYLREYGRCVALPISYTELLYYNHSKALRDESGRLTHWETAIYEPYDLVRLNSLLINTYNLLNASKLNKAAIYEVESIDFCEFGNSVPFRINLLNTQTGIKEHFYVKLADASRMYGLELEHLLSPDTTNFLYDNNTLVEAHIQGIPGDMFLQQHMRIPASSGKELAKAFVRFNERCFSRLLGDMRSYNFVVETKSEHEAYTIRPIDFDQQSYEGRKNLYLPQFYKENFEFVNLVLALLSKEEILQLQRLELNRVKSQFEQNSQRVEDLLTSMKADELSEQYKILQLRKELNQHFNTTVFSSCESMGDLVETQLNHLLNSVLPDKLKSCNNGHN